MIVVSVEKVSCHVLVVLTFFPHFSRLYLANHRNEHRCYNGVLLYVTVVVNYCMLSGLSAELVSDASFADLSTVRAYISLEQART